MKIEYRVRPVTRYVVTRWHKDSFDEESGDSPSGSVATAGEFDSYETAFAVAYALCKEEHMRLGYPAGDDRIQYPKHKGLDSNS